MRILAILVVVCTLLSVGCSSEKSGYDAGIAAYKRGHYAVALSNFESRAIEGDPVAQFCLGYMYKHGEGVKANTQTALDWYTKAAAHGHVPALNNRALIYGQMAMEWRLSLEGEALARLREGKDFKAHIDDRGKEIIRGLEASVEGFGEGIKIDLDNPTGQYGGLAAYNLALLQVEIQSEATKESNKNVVFLLEFAAKTGYTPAQNQLATIYRDGLWGESPDSKKAEEWYTKAADKGFAPAQYNLAEMIWERGGKENQGSSLEWYLKAANEGFAPAQYKLGQLYEDFAQNSKGNKKKEEGHWKEAIKWFTKAADQGDVSAKSDLSLLYGAGKGVHENAELALRLSFEAAQEGDAWSAYMLADMFEKGNMLSQDDMEAYYWYNLALKNKNTFKKTIHPDIVDVGSFITDMSEERDRIGKKLSEEQRSKIQERVDKWEPRILAGSGTGFYIDKKHILTNVHVARKEEVLLDGSEKWHKYDELRIGFRYVVEKPGTESFDPDIDLALLLDPRGDMDNFPTFRSDPLKLDDVGEDIASFGYPLSISWLSYQGNGTLVFLQC